MMESMRLRRNAIWLVALMAIYLASVTWVHAQAAGDEAAPNDRLVGRMPFVPLTQQEQVFHEGEFRLDEELAIKLPPLKPLPGVAVGVESVRFYADGGSLRATVRLSTDKLPAGMYVFARLDLLGENGRSCYSRRSFIVSTPNPPGSNLPRVEGGAIDVQLYSLQLTKDKVRRFRISLNAVDVFSGENPIEGTVALRVPIPARLKADLPDFPDAVKLGGLRFGKAEKNDHFYAFLGGGQTAIRDSKWVADLAVLDRNGKRLSRARLVFATTNRPGPSYARDSSEMHFYLGRWTKAKEACRFRLGLKRAPDDAVVSFEAPFELGRASNILLYAGTRRISNFAMVRNVRFGQSDQGQAQATLRVGGLQVADTEWRIRLELLDEAGGVLQSAVTTLTTQKKEEYQPSFSVINHPYESDVLLDLGSLREASKATRFRISLWQLDK